MEAASWIILADDCGDRPAADETVGRLGDECNVYKVGLVVFTAAFHRHSTVLWRHWFASATMGQLRERLADTGDIASALRAVDAAAA